MYLIMSLVLLSKFFLLLNWLNTRNSIRSLVIPVTVVLSFDSRCRVAEMEDPGEFLMKKF